MCASSSFLPPAYPRDNNNFSLDFVSAREVNDDDEANKSFSTLTSACTTCFTAPSAIRTAKRLSLANRDSDQKANDKASCAEMADDDGEDDDENDDEEDIEERRDEDGQEEMREDNAADDSAGSAVTIALIILAQSA